VNAPASPAKVSCTLREAGLRKHARSHAAYTHDGKMLPTGRGGASGYKVSKAFDGRTVVEYRSEGSSYNARREAREVESYRDALLAAGLVVDVEQSRSGADHLLVYRASDG
jgi:hypothetical protein